MIGPQHWPSPGTVGTKGQITISSDARARLTLEAGATLIEIVVGGLLICIPTDPAVVESQEAFAATLAARGISAEALLADIEARKDETDDALYRPTG